MHVRLACCWMAAWVVASVGMTTPLLAAVAPVSRPATNSREDVEVRKLLLRLRDPRLTPEQWRQACDQMLKLGEDGPRRLAFQLRDDFTTRAPAYFNRFARLAGEALRARSKGIDLEKEVTALRKAAMEASRSPNLSKELISEKMDPAVKRLGELLSLSPADVLKHAPELEAQRQELLAILSVWRQAMPLIPAEMRKQFTNMPDPAELEKMFPTWEESAAAQALPMSDADRAALSANAELARQLDPGEAECILKLNIVRVWLGIGVVSIDPRLCAAARDHSNDMDEKKFFSHTSPVPGKESPWQRARNFGTSAGAENIAAGSGSGEGAFRMWWYSPGHHRNMMGGHKRIGVGRKNGVWTMMAG